MGDGEEDRDLGVRSSSREEERVGESCEHKRRWGDFGHRSGGQVRDGERSTHGESWLVSQHLLSHRSICT